MTVFSSVSCEVDPDDPTLAIFLSSEAEIKRPFQRINPVQRHGSAANLLPFPLIVQSLTQSAADQ
jgi:hypothetical protein